MFLSSATRVLAPRGSFETLRTTISTTLFPALLNVVQRSVSGDSLKARIPPSNRNIRARKVRLVGTDGKQIGVMPLEEAISRAAELDLDVIQSKGGEIPVCKMQSLHALRTQLREAMKREEATAPPDPKEIQLRIGIEAHDFNTKTDKANELLSKGGPVRFMVLKAARDVPAAKLLMERASEAVKAHGTCRVSNEGMMMCQPLVTRAVLYKRKVEATQKAEQPQPEQATVDSTASSSTTSTQTTAQSK